MNMMTLWTYVLPVCFAASIQNSPQNAVFAKIDNHIANSEFEQAKELLSGLKDQAPSEVLWRQSRVTTLEGDKLSDEGQQLKKYEEAKALADKALGSDPESMMALLRRAVANGKIAIIKGILGGSATLVNETRKDTEKAITLNNRSEYELALAHYLLARTHLKLSQNSRFSRSFFGLEWGNEDDARKNFEKAYSLYPNSVVFKVDYAKFLFSKGEKEKALQVLEGFDSLPKSDPGDKEKIEDGKRLQSQ